MVIAIIVLHNLEIHQMNAKIAFLNIEIQAKIYMEQHEEGLLRSDKTKKCVSLSNPCMD